MSAQFYPEAWPSTVAQRRVQEINDHWARLTADDWNTYQPEFGSCELNRIPSGNCPVCWPRFSLLALDPETGVACDCSSGCSSAHVERALFAPSEEVRRHIAEGVLS